MKALAAVAVAMMTFAFASTASAAPTPVLLGNAGLFAVLAGGGITNTGVSTIGGDVGSSSNPAQTGFAACPAADCVALTGANHIDPSPNDTATQNGKAALITAYDSAAGQSPTMVATELGGQTLVAGVYRAASDTFGMTGTLVLDGANNADSTFVFQMGTTLTTANTGNVTFIRGAQACNVFWQVGSSATLGANSNFSGNILAKTSISLGDGVTVQGRLLADEQGTTGAVTLIHDTITKPTCVTQASIDATAAAAAAAAQAQAQAVAAAAAAQAQAQAAAAAQAASEAQAAADQAAAAAKEADAKAAAAAADKAAAAAVVAAQAAAAATAAADKAAAVAAAAATAAADKAAAVVAKAVTAKKAAAKAAAAARVAKAAAAKAATAKRIALKLSSIRTARRHAGFTG
jgi:hypothetical protein